MKKITVWPKKKDYIDGKEANDKELVAVWGVPTYYLQNSYRDIRYRDIRYREVQYNTLDNLVKRQVPRNKKASILD